MRVTHFITVGLLAAVLAVGLAFSTRAADDAKPAKPAAKPGSSLDDQLLKDLDNDLLDDVGGLKKTTPKPPAAKPAGDKHVGEKPSGENPTEPGAKPEKPLLPPPGEDIGQEEEEPLARIAREMRTVESLIQQRNNEATNERQKQIVADLARLLEQLEQQQQKQSQSQSKSQQQTAQRQQVQQPGSSQPGNKPSDKPAQDSSSQMRKNEVQKADMGQMKGLMKDLWGQLPERAREQMLQTSPEQFLPKYELLIEQYYKRLAEQQERK